MGPESSPEVSTGRRAYSVSSAAFSPDGARIVTGSFDRTARVWDARTGSPRLELKGHTWEVYIAAFSPDGARIVTGGYNQTARVWDARAGSPRLELKGHTGKVQSAAFSPDGARIVTGAQDQTARVWDAATGSPLLELKGHPNWVYSAAFSPDGARIVTGSQDRTARVWDARTGSPLLELKGHTSAVWSAAFSPDGARIITGGDDQAARVWDAVTGSPVLELKGHRPRLTSAAFSPDGTRIVAYGNWGQLTVWDARTGEELKGEPVPAEPRPGPISPDGRRIAHADDNRVELIPLQPDGEELAYRSLLMRPNFARYQESYEAAIASGDEFAARFYLNLFPPAERNRIQAKMIVKPLFDRLFLRDDVLAAIEAQPVPDPEVQAACLNLAGTWPQFADQHNNVAWRLVRDVGRSDADYERGLRLARATCRLEPDNATYLNTLGVAQYRCGLMAEALATLTRSNDRNQQKLPEDLAFLALAQHRLGLSEPARETLGRLRAVLKDPQQAGNSESQAFLREAETIELDRVFPADPFAP
jgi:hypothetical protein